MDDIEAALAIITTQNAKTGQTAQQPKGITDGSIVKSVNLDNYASGAQTNGISVHDLDVENLYEEHPHGDNNQTGGKTRNDDGVGDGDVGNVTGMSHIGMSQLVHQYLQQNRHQFKWKVKKNLNQWDCWLMQETQIKMKIYKIHLFHQKLMHQMTTMIMKQ